MRARSGTMFSSSRSRIVRRYISVVSMRSVTRSPPCRSPSSSLAGRRPLARLVRMPSLVIPSDLLPADGRFGCGPSKVRPEQLAHLAARGPAPPRHVAPPGAREGPRRSRAQRPRRPVRPARRLRGRARQRRLDGVLGCRGIRPHRATRAARARSASSARSSPAPPRRPWLEAPDVRKADAGTRANPEPVAGVDVYAWPHNETSTGVMAPVDPGRRRRRRAHRDRRDERGRRRRRRPVGSSTSTTSRRRRTSRPTAASGSRCSPPPRSSASSASPRATATSPSSSR